MKNNLNCNHQTPRVFFFTLFCFKKKKKITLMQNNDSRHFESRIFISYYIDNILSRFESIDIINNEKLQLTTLKPVHSFHTINR